MSTERRRHRRFGLARPVSVSVGGRPPVTGRLMDMSAGGAFFAARIEVAIDANAYVRFGRPRAVPHASDDSRELCEATGRVVRVMPFGDEAGVGVEFGFANAGLIYFLRELAAVTEVERPELLSQIEELTIQIE